MLQKYKDNLINWSKRKYRIHNKKKRILFQEREIWWCSVGLNVGHETYGKGASFARPVLVYKKIDYDTFIGLPMTTKVKEIDGWYEYNGASIIFPQIRTLSARRLKSRHKKISKGNFSAITQALLEYLDPKYQLKK